MYLFYSWEYSVVFCPRIPGWWEREKERLCDVRSFLISPSSKITWKACRSLSRYQITAVYSPHLNKPLRWKYREFIKIKNFQEYFIIAFWPSDNFLFIEAKCRTKIHLLSNFKGNPYQRVFWYLEFFLSNFL